jgi:hypothetical protein
MPGSMSTIAITPVSNTNIIKGIIQRFICVSSELLSLQPISPKLSSNMVSDQPKAGFTSVEANMKLSNVGKERKTADFFNITPLV